MSAEAVTHPVDLFRAELDDVPDEVFPDCLERVNTEELEDAAGGPIGVAAFPVSHGLYADPGWDHAELPPFPAAGEGLMIIGNHPHSKQAALERLREHGAHGDPDPAVSPMVYWRELYRLLDDAGIDRHRIFATNIHPAFFSATSGQVPRRGNETWFRHARRLLTLQITTMKPQLLLALGGVARRGLAGLALGVPELPLNEPSPWVVAGHKTIALHLRHPSAPGTTHAHRQERARVLASAWHDGVAD